MPKIEDAINNWIDEHEFGWSGNWAVPSDDVKTLVLGMVEKISKHTTTGIAFIDVEPEKYKQKKVVAINSLGECTIYNSASEAARELGIASSNISNCLRGKKDSAYGYYWRYYYVI